MNYMNEIAKVLGVKIGEVFSLENCVDEKHKIENDGWYTYNNAEKAWEQQEDGILSILTGKVKIVHSWKPTDGERYYIPCVNSPEMYDYWTWQDDNLDQYRFEHGLAFKTMEEAVELTKKMLTVVKEARNDG